MDPLSSFRERFGAPRVLVGMLHVGPLPGTPAARDSIDRLIEQTVAEARIYRDAGFTALALENMHDRPYLKGGVGPEVTAAMTALAREVKRETGLMLGIQVLAAANREALAVALACGADFIRAEGFVFAHVADEGFVESCAGELLRYRRAIGAERVLVFADIKKKHSAHAITGDVSLVETARAAELFLADGVVVTGPASGEEASPEDVRDTARAVRLPVIVGSGVSAQNLARFADAHGFIVGTSLKQGGIWSNPLDRTAVESLVRASPGWRSDRATLPRPPREPAGRRPRLSRREHQHGSARRRHHVRGFGGGALGDPGGVCQPGRHRLPGHDAGRTGRAPCRPDRLTSAPWTRRAHLAPLRGSPATLDPSPGLPDARAGVTRTRAHSARLALGTRIPPRSDAVHGAAPTACVADHGTEPLRVGRSAPADYPGDARGLAASPGRGRRFFPSEDELLLEETQVHPERVLPRLATGRLRFIVFKQAARGGILYDAREDRFHRWLGRASKVVDPTGAGDAFAAGFVSAHLEGLPVDACLDRGVVSASFAIEGLGAASLLEATRTGARA